MPASRRRAFTLVELLVVIGIIALLIAILIPVGRKVRRHAVVLASPICFQTFQDNALHLTDPHGGYDLAVTPSFGWFHARRPGNTMWSPSGLRIGFELSNWPAGNGGTQQYLCVLDPASGTMTKVKQTASQQPRSYFAGWYDNDHVIEEANGTLFVRDVDTGAVTLSVAQGESRVGTGPFYTVPAGLPGRWIAVVYGSVRFIKPDFTPGRAVWIPGQGELRAGSDFQVDVDPYGEWVAWTASDGSSVHATAFKPVAAPASAPPSYLPTSIGWFCSWTDDGNLLLRGGSGFVVVNKDGEMIRQMTFDDYPQGEVTWRRYGRQ